MDVLGTISASSADVICIVDCVQLTELDLSTILHILRPEGILWILQMTVQTDADSKPATDSVISALTLGGFVKPYAEVFCKHCTFLWSKLFFEKCKAVVVLFHYWCKLTRWTLVYGFTKVQNQLLFSTVCHCRVLNYGFLWNFRQGFSLVERMISYIFCGIFPKTGASVSLVDFTLSNKAKTAENIDASVFNICAALSVITLPACDCEL